MNIKLIVLGMRILPKLDFLNNWLCDLLRAAVLADPEYALGYLLFVMRKSRDSVFCSRLLGVLLLIPDDILESHELMQSFFANELLHSG